MNNALVLTSQAHTADQPAQKSRGSRPTHRLSRVTEANGAKKFEEVGALWPHKDGKGFTIKLKTALNPGDNLMIRMDTRGVS